MTTRTMIVAAGMLRGKHVAGEYGLSLRDVVIVTPNSVDQARGFTFDNVIVDLPPEEWTLALYETVTIARAGIVSL